MATLISSRRGLQARFAGRWSRARAVLVAGVTFASVSIVAPPLGAAPREGRDDDARPAKGDLARIDRELKEQRALLEKVARSEQEHYESVRRLLEKPAPATTAGAGRGTTSPGASGSAGSPEISRPSEGNDAGEAQPAAPRPAPLTFAHVTGRVSSTAGSLRDVYVYLEGFRSAAGRNAFLEVSQVGKQFEPRFAVALLGTRVSFPNRDTFFHNVFSPAPVPFDLGTYRANEASPSVVLKSPGVVEIFCNIHAQMSAQILVVPNRVFAKVNDDGTFRLDKVPTGRRKLVAWGPGLRPVRLEVNVVPAGTEASFALEPDLPVRHKNKFGQPYGSYKE